MSILNGKRRSTKKGVPDRHFLLGLFVLSFMLMAFCAFGQCSISCQTSSSDDPILLALDGNCQVTILPETVLSNLQTCPGTKNIVVRDAAGTLIAQSDDRLEVDLSAYLREQITLTVRDIATGTFCTAVARPVDTSPPVIDCEDLVIACTADTALSATGVPTVTDNCDAECTLSYSESVETTDCNSNGTLLITRFWKAVDASGNAAQCTQSIVLDRPSLNTLQFPGPVDLDCSDSGASIARTGQPLIEGAPIDNDNERFCDLAVSFEDDTTASCGGVERVILRHWRVLETCTGELIRHTQRIRFQDLQPPVISCPDDIITGTSSGRCDATVRLPSPDLQDNCDQGAYFTISTSFGGVGAGPHYGVPAGTHFVTYTATDACGNTSNCTITLTVQDEETPTAVCEDEARVSLNNSGIAIITAQDFDEGSSDNCKDELFYKVRRDSIGHCQELNGDDAQLQAGYQEWFDDAVYFCCTDVSRDSLYVTLRVYERNPGHGPVDPAREQPGGELFGTFNECRVRVTLLDQIAPDLAAPPDTTVDCSIDLSDLSAFGIPELSDNCNAAVTEQSFRDLDRCNTGVITRRFKASDDSGNSSTAEQHIFVENLNPLQADSIVWPRDFTSERCGVPVDPNDLPEGFARPEVEYQSCSMIGLSHEDRRFDLSYPACYKILRDWQVIDWCTYDPDHSATEGLFTYTQVIKIEDTEAPVITQCPERITVGVNTTCQTANIDLPRLEARDCSPNVFISNDSPYAVANGPDASGEYPLGETLVTFTAQDRCGNTSQCELMIEVIDNKKPSPICIAGLSVNLAEMDDGATMAILDAGAFDGNSFDNCTTGEDLHITVRRAIENPQEPATQEQLVFTCADIGTQLVEMWVSDAAGNADYCVTYVSVQDNNNICPLGSVSGNISGGIRMENDKEVEDVSVSIRSEDPFATLTGSDGVFQLAGLPFGKDYEVVPSKYDDPLNGISTYDVILISKHILGVKQFATPYQYIAADVDGSGRISTLDLIKLRKLILGQEDAFPATNTPWRFIDGSFEFPDDRHPLQVDFPESKQIASFRSQSAKVDFLAVKVGDVNGSARPNSILQSAGRTTSGDMVVKVKNRDFQPGEHFTVALRSEDLFNLQGYQFTLDYDERLLELTTYEAGDLPGMGPQNLELVDPMMGRLTTAYSEDVGITTREAPLMRLHFRAKREGDLLSALALSSTPTLAEAYDHRGEAQQVLLQFLDTSGGTVLRNSYRLYQNYPNPFSTMTRIGFTLPQKEAVTLSVFDAAGRLILRRERVFHSGYQEWNLYPEDLQGEGLLYYRLECADFSAVRQMIRQGS